MKKLTRLFHDQSEGYELLAANAIANYQQHIMNFNSSLVGQVTLVWVMIRK